MRGSRSFSVKPGTALHRFVQEEIAQGIQKLLEVNLFDLSANVPKSDEIERRIKPYMGRQESGLPKDLDTAVFCGLPGGTANEALGNIEEASEWYRVGQYIWRGGSHFEKYLNVDPMDLSILERESPAMWQGMAGLCAALAGNINRAKDLFSWAGENRRRSREEMEAQESSKNYQSVWQPLGYRIYSLTWLGYWEEVMELAEIGMRLVEKTRRAGHPREFRGPQLLISIGYKIAYYFIHPTDETLTEAGNTLVISKIPDRNPRTRFNLMPYLFALKRRYTELGKGM